MMMQQVPPSTQAGEDYNRMAARIPYMDDEQLETFVNTGFGALALIEITKRNRQRLAKKAQQAAQNQPTGTMADAEIQKMMQAKMASRLASDDRIGLNNIIAQAEQGGLEFGQPTQRMSGGGMVAFADGRYPVDREREDRSRFAEVFGIEPAAIPGAVGTIVSEGVRDLELGNLLDFLSRKTPEEREQEEAEKQLSRERILEAGASMRGKTRTPGVMEGETASGMPREARGVTATATEPSAITAKPEAKPAKLTGEQRAGLQSLFTTDPAKILEQRKKLLEAQGIGAFGADVEKMLGESEEKTKRGLEGLKLTRAATAGAKAVGGRGRERKEGLEALAAAVSGAAEGAGSVAERELEVQSKFDEFRMKQAMAKDAYERGEVGKAQELAMSAQKDQRDFQLEREKLDVLKDRVAAAAAKGAKGKIPETLLTQFQKEIAEIEGAFSSGAIDETEYARRMASAERRQRDMLGSIMLAGLEFGERATTE